MLAAPVSAAPNERIVPILIKDTLSSYAGKFEQLMELDIDYVRQANTGTACIMMVHVWITV